MVQITVDDVTYTFSRHAEDRMLEEEATYRQVEAAIADPDRTELSRSSGRMIYMKQFPNRKHPLIVVLDEEKRKIVTVYWSNP